MLPGSLVRRRFRPSARYSSQTRTWQYGLPFGPVPCVISTTVGAPGAASGQSSGSTLCTAAFAGMRICSAWLRVRRSAILLACLDGLRAGVGQDVAFMKYVPHGHGSLLAGCVKDRPLVQVVAEHPRR